MESDKLIFINSMQMKLNKGFTIIEVLVTLAILAVIVAIALPTYSDFSRRQVLKSGGQVLVRTFNSARVEAVTSIQSSSVVCWNTTAGIVDMPVGADQTVPVNPNDIVVGQGTVEDGIIDLVSVKELISPSGGITISDNEDTDSCIEYDNQGRLNVDEVDNQILGFWLCRGNNDSVDSLRLEVTGSGRAVVKQNTDTTGLGVQVCP